MCVNALFIPQSTSNHLKSAKVFVFSSSILVIIVRDPDGANQIRKGKTNIGGHLWVLPRFGIGIILLLGIAVISSSFSECW